MGLRPLFFMVGIVRYYVLPPPVEEDEEQTAKPSIFDFAKEKATKERRRLEKEGWQVYHVEFL